MKGTAFRLALVAVVAALVTAACGGSSEGGGLFGTTEPPTTRATTTTEGTTTTTTTPTTTTTAPTTTTTSSTTTTSTTTSTTTTSTTTTSTTTTTTTTVPDSPTAALPSGTPYSGFELLTDDTGLLEVRVPAEWLDRWGDGWLLDDEIIGPGMGSAPDYDAYLANWSAPGMFFGATDLYPGTVDEWLDISDFSVDCVHWGREDYDDGEYAGLVDIWVDCGGTAVFVTIAAEPYEGGALVVVEVSLVTQADVEAFEAIQTSFRLLGPLN